MTAMAPQFTHITNRKLQPDRNILRIHILHVHVRKAATPLGWHSYGRYGQVQVGRNSS